MRKGAGLPALNNLFVGINYLAVGIYRFEGAFGARKLNNEGLLLFGRNGQVVALFWGSWRYAPAAISYIDNSIRSFFPLKKWVSALVGVVVAFKAGVYFVLFKEWHPMFAHKAACL